MNVNLSAEIEQFVDEQVKAGNFPTREALLEVAISQLRTTYEMTDEDRAEIALSDQEFERGDVVEFKDFAQRMRSKHGISGHG